MEIKVMKKEEKIDFEHSLKQLEQIVQTMEDESLPLETLIEKYELGIKMVQQCEGSLKLAHKQLEVIRSKRNNSRTPSASKSTNNTDDEIQLF